MDVGPVQPRFQQLAEPLLELEYSSRVDVADQPAPSAMRSPTRAKDFPIPGRLEGSIRSSSGSPV